MVVYRRKTTGKLEKYEFFHTLLMALLAKLEK